MYTHTHMHTLTLLSHFSPGIIFELICSSSQGRIRILSTGMVSFCRRVNTTSGISAIHCHVRRWGLTPCLTDCMFLFLKITQLMCTLGPRGCESVLGALPWSILPHSFPRGCLRGAMVSEDHTCSQLRGSHDAETAARGLGYLTPGFAHACSVAANFL